MSDSFEKWWATLPHPSEVDKYEPLIRESFRAGQLAAEQRVKELTEQLELKTATPLYTPLKAAGVEDQAVYDSIAANYNRPNHREAMQMAIDYLTGNYVGPRSIQRDVVVVALKEALR